MDKSTPLAGGGASAQHLSQADTSKIQEVANRYQVTISLVGSRAAGTSNPLSDFDYVMAASHRVRNSAKFFLPRGPRVGEGAGIDIFQGPLDPTRPYLTFVPVSKEL